jgi:hypothetical protein
MARRSRSSPPIDSTGLPATTNSARIGRLASRQVAGEVAATVGAELAFGERIGEDPTPGLRARIEAYRQHVAAVPVEVAGDEGEHVHQPVRQGALAPHVDAGGHVDRGRRCDGEVVCQAADGGGVDAGDNRHAFGRVARDEATQLLDAVGVGRHGLAVEADGSVDLTQHGGEQVDVGVGSDGDEFAGARFHRFDPARIDEHDAGAAPACGLERGGRIRQRDEAPVADSRVGAEDQQKIGALDVGHRVDGRGAEDRLAAGELVGAILSAGVEAAPCTELAQEVHDLRRAQRVERGGVADVVADGLRAVGLDDAAQPRGDVVDRGGPADALAVAVGAPSQGVVEAIGVVVDLHAGQALVAGESARDRVLAVGSQPGQDAVFDFGQQAAGGFAHATEGGNRLFAHG